MRELLANPVPVVVVWAGGTAFSGASWWAAWVAARKGARKVKCAVANRCVHTRWK